MTHYEDGRPRMPTRPFALALLGALMFANAARAAEPDTTDIPPVAAPATEREAEQQTVSAPPADPAIVDAERRTLRARFRRGQRLAVAGSMAMPTGMTLVAVAAPYIDFWGPDDHPAAEPTLLSGLALMTVSIPLQLSGTYVERRALRAAGCAPHPPALKYVAPTLVAGTLAGASIEWWGIMPEFVPFLALGAWGAGSVETVMLRSQGKRCEGLQSN